MAGLPGWLYNQAMRTLYGANDEDYASARYGSDRYKPTVQDVLDAKKELQSKSNLPIELIDIIIDKAEYWPHTTTTLPQSRTVHGGTHAVENQLMLRSFPLGYVPPSPSTSPSDMNPYHIGSDRDGRPYETAPSQPWPPGRHAPHEATQELHEHWAAESLPRGEHPCRKIVFTIESHDQGFGGSWSHRGSYEGSYTWFDVGLERALATRERDLALHPELAPLPHFTAVDGLTQFLQTAIPSTPAEPDQQRETYDFHHPLLPSTKCLQKNATATRETKKYEITWSCDDDVVPDSLEAGELAKLGRGSETADGKFVRDLKVGDVVTVWAKARFPQWRNEVEHITMDIYWAV